MTKTNNFSIPDFSRLELFIGGEKWTDIAGRAQRIAETAESWVPDRHRDDDLRLLREADAVLGTWLRALMRAGTTVSAAIDGVKLGDPKIDELGRWAECLNAVIDMMAAVADGVSKAYAGLRETAMDSPETSEAADTVGRLSVRLDAVVRLLENLRDRTRIHDALSEESEASSSETLAAQCGADMDESVIRHNG